MKQALLFVCFFFVASSFAQEKKTLEGMGVEGNVFVGNLFRHSQTMTSRMPESTWGAEINIVKHLHGQKPWHQQRNFPWVGLGLMFLDYNSPDVFGQVWGIYPNIQFPLIRASTWEWTFRAGFGLSYVTKPFERFPDVNLENTAIGGHWNNISPFSTDFRYQLNKQMDFQAGLSFVHVSNASFQQPNLGLNMWSAHLGLRYFPSGNRGTNKPSSSLNLSNRWLIHARAGIAFIDSWPGNGPINPSYMGSVYTSKRYWSKNKAFAGIDLHYHSGMYVFLKSIENEVGKEKWASTQLALFAGHEFIYGPVGLLFQGGVYLHRTYQQPELFYQKLGCNIYLYQAENGILKEVFVSTLLKTHLFTAELFEMGVGIGF